MTLPSKMYSDSELLVRMSENEVAALSELYDRYSARLYGLAMKILNDQGMAEDTVQELFIYLWENADRFDKRRGNPVSWLMVLCRNRGIDKLRALKKKQKRTMAMDVEKMAEIGGDESDSPLHIVGQEEVQQKTDAALGRLPEEQRQPILLAYFEGMSQSEIAERLKVPIGTVKTRVRLGMQKLRNLMTEFRHSRQ